MVLGLLHSWVLGILHFCYRLKATTTTTPSAGCKNEGDGSEGGGTGAAKVQTDEEGKVQDMISNSAKTKTEFALFGGEKKTEGKQSAARLRRSHNSKVTTGDGIGERWNLF